MCRQTKDLTKEKSPGDKILNLFYLKNSQNIVCVKARVATIVLVILHQNDYGIQQKAMESSLTKMITCFESI